MPSEMNRSVSFTLTADDYVVANKLYTWHAFRPVVIIAMIGTLLLMGFYFRSDDAAAGFEHLATFFYLAAAGFMVLPFLTYFVFAPQTARKTYDQQKSLQQPISLSWSQAGLKSASEAGEWLMPWEHYLKREENDQIVLFYQAPRLFQMLPKRYLTPEQLADLRTCAANVKG